MAQLSLFLSLFFVSRNDRVLTGKTDTIKSPLDIVECAECVRVIWVRRPGLAGCRETVRM